ncbi:hypothetical protein [Nocardioides insulae]|uniref:hypothetical protein n=1 Tax=Nocardioides insulae TaxID=394734 RepID=UPI0003FCF16E|nr:hypothetical protein [Nocardioides insulae]
MLLAAEAAVEVTVQGLAPWLPEAEQRETRWRTAGEGAVKRVGLVVDRGHGRPERLEALAGTLEGAGWEVLRGDGAEQGFTARSEEQTFAASYTPGEDVLTIRIEGAAVYVGDRAGRLADGS